MHALGPIEYRRDQPRCVYLKEARMRRGNQCPQCDEVAPAPVSSACGTGGTVVHAWACQSCACTWHTSFQPLLV